MIKPFFHQTRRWLARIWLELNPQLRIVGITGSFGKTNTSVAIARVLAQKYPTVKTDLNLDTIYNLPMTILQVKPWTEALVLEMGVDHQGEMDFHLSLVKPKIGVLTGITPVHSDEEHLRSIQGIIKEKGKLLACLPKDGLAVLNFDDQEVRKMARLSRAPVLFYGKDKKNCDLWASNIKVTVQGLTFDLNLKNKDKLKISTGLIGSHHVNTCMAAYLVGSYLGVSDGQIQKALGELKPLLGRLNLEKGPMGSILINDSRRANPASTIAGLTTLSDLPGKRKIAVLGEMGELGSFSKKGHQMVGEELAELKIDFLIGVGPLTKNIADAAIRNGFPAVKTFWTSDVCQAAQVLRKILKKGDMLYLKGSLLRHMERVLLYLEGKKVICKKVSCHCYQLCSNCPEITK